MSDIVKAAIHAHMLEGTATVTWQVTFLNNLQYAGTIRDLGDGKYVLDCDGLPYYFAPDKVIYMVPDTSRL
ncbi:MAG TPA: hypothetical protein VF793_21705 [Telluria sp.]|jgi:hypothetical protein